MKNTLCFHKNDDRLFYTTMAILHNNMIVEVTNYKPITDEDSIIYIILEESIYTSLVEYMDEFFNFDLTKYKVSTIKRRP